MPDEKTVLAKEPTVLAIHDLIFVAPEDVRPDDEVLRGAERERVERIYRLHLAVLRTPVHVLLADGRRTILRRARKYGMMSTMHLPTKADVNDGRLLLGRDLKLHGPNFRRTVAVKRVIDR